MGEFLEKQLERTNTWLSFAEAKNAAIVAINVAVIAFVYSLKASPLFLGYAILILLTLSTLVSLVSFFPKVKRDVKRTARASTEINLTFWGDVACVENGRKYLELVKDKYFHESASNVERAMHVDLANEIITNSRIAVSKYSKFKVSLVMDIIALAMCLGLFALDFF